MRLWKLHLAEHIFGTLISFTSGCDPRNSPKVTHRWMELFQTWVFFLQDYDTEENVSTQGEWGRSTKWKKGWRVQRLCLLPHLYSRVLNCPLEWDDLAAHGMCRMWIHPLFFGNPMPINGAIFLPLNRPPNLHLHTHILWIGDFCVRRAILSIPTTTATCTAFLGYRK